MKPRAITIRDIADRLGVTHSTVSRALSPGKGRSRMSEATRERIAQAARELGYRPNALARDLVCRRTHSIGVVVRHFNDPFYSDMIQDLHVRFAQRNYLGVFLSARNLDEFQHAVDSLASRRVEGIISVALDQEERQRIGQIGVPVVYYGTLGGSETWVGPDARCGAVLAMEHLLGLGHRKIGFIGQIDSQSRRYRGYRETLQRQGLPSRAAWIRKVDGAQSRLSVSGVMQTGFSEMQQLLALADRPTSVLCQNDVMAIGAERAVLAAGRRVPEDMALIGFDGLPLGAFAAVPLTTVDPNLDRICEGLVDTLFCRIEDPVRPAEPEQIRIEPSLIIRESTAGRAARADDAVKTLELRRRTGARIGGNGRC